MKLLKIKNCSACGRDHLNVEIKPLARQEKIGGVRYNYYTICPETRSTVYVSFHTEETIKNLARMGPNEG